MCGRYLFGSEHEEDGGTGGGIVTVKDVCPGDTAEVLCFSKAGNMRSFKMKWGWHTSRSGLLINARSETAETKALFSNSAAHRRCLMPMNGYYEWEKRGRDRIKYLIAPEVPAQYCLAGLYRHEVDGPSFVVLTMEAAGEIRFIHPRMPLIISMERAEDWLRGGPLQNGTSGIMGYRIAI